MFEHLNVTANLLSRTLFPSAAKDEIGYQLISTTWFLVDDNLATAEDGDLSNGFHEGVFHIFWPDLFRVFLSSVYSLKRQSCQ